MAFENRYSALDRLLHRLAFSTRKAQIGLADVEDLLFRDQLVDYELDGALFIAALPRAGTTLLLELCVASGEFAAHTYRHMPFILIPMLWSRFSKGFRRSDAPRERAHGDGMMVSVDSPEAFEETVWLTFWPKHYQEDRIIPWRDQEDSVFRDFLEKHFKKIVALSMIDGDAHTKRRRLPPRYVSKNNLNIARIAWLTRNFREALVVIPFRDPLQHCASLLRQHLNFLEIHRRDAFAKRYMQAIGHFDFGENLRPVDFDSWCEKAKPYDSKGMEFWLTYWCAAYQSLIKDLTTHVGFLNFDAFCADPKMGLEHFADFIQAKARSALVAQAERIHALSSHEIDCTILDTSLVEEARALHAHLAERSIV